MNTEVQPPNIPTPNHIHNAPQKLEHPLHLPDRQNLVLDLLSSCYELRRWQREIDMVSVFLLLFHAFKFLWAARREDRE